MGKAIVIGGVVVIVVLAVLVWLAFELTQQNRQDDKRAGLPLKGDLTAAQERQLGDLLLDAHRILSAIGVNSTVEQMADPELIRTTTRRDVAAWMARYRKAKQL